MADTERFWSKVEIGEPDECWLWKRYRDRKGYGHIGWAGKVEASHRVAYKLHYALRSLPHGIQVMHSCDNPPCCNPKHLMAGTNRDNQLDCVAKGRNNPPRGDAHPARLHPERLARGDRHGSRTHPERLKRGDEHGSRTHPEKLKRGSANGNAVLDERMVSTIRECLAAGVRQTDIMQKYGISRPTVYSIKHRKTWRHV